jgi:hypothetical protein
MGNLEDLCSFPHSLPFIQETLRICNFPASFFEEEIFLCFSFTQAMYLRLNVRTVIRHIVASLQNGLSDPQLLAYVSLCSYFSP